MLFSLPEVDPVQRLDLGRGGEASIDRAPAQEGIRYSPVGAFRA